DDENEYFPLRISAPNSEVSGLPGISNKQLLGECVPNPALNNETVISYTLPENTEQAAITVYETATGRAVLFYPLEKEGTKLQINTGTLAPGIYMLKFDLNGVCAATRRLAVIK
ncbi:MAG: T9SS type A sorting domain-containing protein, partial [Bacteroidota bacterium]